MARVIASLREAGLMLDPRRLRVLWHHSPKSRYRVGTDANWIPRLRQLLPEALFECVIGRVFGLTAKNSSEHLMPGASSSRSCL